MPNEDHDDQPELDFENDFSSDLLNLDTHEEDFPAEEASKA